jgi:hypothetical protein
VQVVDEILKANANDTSAWIPKSQLLSGQSKVTEAIALAHTTVSNDLNLAPARYALRLACYT